MAQEISAEKQKVVTTTVDRYQVTNISAAFYLGGGPMESCVLAVRGRKGTGDGAAFEQAPGQAGQLDMDLRDAEVLSLLGVPVANLPQDKTLLEILLGMVDTALKAKGVV